MPTKHCPRCGKAKATSEFNRNRSRSDGIEAFCRVCDNLRTRAKRAARIAAAPVVPAAPALPPLENAYQEHAKATAKRDLQAEHKALLEENKRLRVDLDAATKISGPVPLTVIVKDPAHRTDAVACVVASDWHVEENVLPEMVNEINEFNLDIAQQRAHRFFRNALKLAEMMARESHIERIWFGGIGDFFTNYIHEELQETNELAPTDAALFAKGLLIEGFEFFLRESKFIIDVDFMHGNHGRMTKKPRIQNSSGTSLETFMFHAIADRFHSNPRINFRVAQGKMLYRRYFEKFNMRIIHGDDIKFGGGVGGITIPIRKKLAAWDKSIRADLTVMGHFHQLMDGGDFLVNGSLIGFNEFAQAIGASPEEARQAFFLIHARNGGTKSGVFPIWVTPEKKEE